MSSFEREPFLVPTNVNLPLTLDQRAIRLFHVAFRSSSVDAYTALIDDDYGNITRGYNELAKSVESVLDTSDQSDCADALMVKTSAGKIILAQTNEDALERDLTSGVRQPRLFVDWTDSYTLRLNARTRDRYSVVSIVQPDVSGHDDRVVRTYEDGRLAVALERISFGTPTSDKDASLRRTVLSEGVWFGKDAIRQTPEYDIPEVRQFIDSKRVMFGPLEARRDIVHTLA
jgi:hypothetical protein